MSHAVTDAVVSSRPRRVDQLLLGLVAVALFHAFAFAMVRTAAYVEAPALIAAALSFDLVVTTSLVFWWLGVRRGGFPLLSVAGVGALGATVAAVVLNATAIATLGVIVESALLLRAGFVVVRVLRAYRSQRSQADDGDVFDALEAALGAGLLPRGASAQRRARLGRFVALELQVLLLGAAGFARPAPPVDDVRSFSQHREGGSGALAMTMVLLSAIEGPIAHVLVHRWSPVGAWVLSGLTLYAVLWVVADHQAQRLRPLRIGSQALRLRVGVRWAVDVPWATVAHVRVVTEGVDDGDTALALSLQRNIRIELTEPVAVRGPFFIERKARQLTFFVDEPDAFVAAATAACGPGKG